MTTKERLELSNEYVELDHLGNIDSAVEKLLIWNETHKDRKAFIEYNGHILKSDTVTTDSAYQEIVGCSKDEYKKHVESERQEYLRKKEEHKAAIPTLTKEWIEKGHKVLDEKYWNFWDKIVPVRLNDLYEGMELGACLEIVEELNKGCTLDKAKEMIYSQGHSEISFGLVRTMVKEFCNRGQEFAEYVK